MVTPLLTGCHFMTLLSTKLVNDSIPLLNSNTLFHKTKQHYLCSLIFSPNSLLLSRSLFTKSFFPLSVKSLSSLISLLMDWIGKIINSFPVRNASAMLWLCFDIGKSIIIEFYSSTASECIFWPWRCFGTSLSIINSFWIWQDGEVSTTSITVQHSP